VIADHVRTLTFAFADGALPSNEGRGYVLRRILRRAARYGRKLDMTEAFIYRLVPTLVAMMGEAFPEIREREDHVTRQIRTEEEGFNRTLDRGLELFEQAARKVIDGKQGGHGDTFPGDVAFELYDTFGFPPDLTRILASERHLAFDEAAFEERIAEQKARSRAAAKFDRLDLSIHGENLKETKFLGYLGTSGAGSVVSFAKDRGELILDATPFYAESGGQVGDTGAIDAEDGSWRFRVRDTKKAGGVIVHFGQLESGKPDAVKAGAKVKSEADRARRVRIMKNHTATHLLHWALHKVVGSHAKQAGSVVEPDRLRFDFSNPEAVRPEQLDEIERLVNGAVFENHDVSKYERSLDEAKKQGVTALFGEKYGERVRVVDIAGFSRELCGGTHVERTGDIGPFKIVEERSVQAGVRRIEALTGPAAVEWMQKAAHALRDLSRELKTPEEKLSERVKQLQQQLKDAKQAASGAKKAAPAAAASAGAKGGGDRKAREMEIGRVLVYFEEMEGASQDDLRARWDELKAKPPVAAILVAPTDAKVVFVAGASKDVGSPEFKGAIEAAAKEAGGRAGGKPDMVQGQLPDRAKVELFLLGVEKALAGVLSAKA
jgi:alanyl-tRNA synthetase